MGAFLFIQREKFPSVKKTTLPYPLPELKRVETKIKQQNELTQKNQF